MTADYSQIELRVMAHLSEDEGLIEAFTSGEDLHTTVASQVFAVEPDGGRRGDAPQDQGDVVRPGVRAVGLRSLPAAEHRARARPAA